jgi:hypothetical protein
MGIPVLRKPVGAFVLTAIVLAAASGCSWLQGEEENLDIAAYDDRITEMYNESNRLKAELDAAETRIVQDCLEAQGFELHDPAEFESFVPTERETFVGGAPHEDFLPEVADAERRGFWHWTAVPGAQEAELEPYGEWLIEQEAFLAESFSAGFAEEMVQGMAGEETELDEFYLREPEDQFAWYTAYAGEDWAAYQHPELTGAEEDGGDESFGAPRPEGCYLEMVEAVYGELTPVENEEDGFTDWIARPEAPAGDGQALHERYQERMDDSGAESDLLDCLDERGAAGWEFESGRLQVREYLVAAGELAVTDDGGSTDGPWPEIPAETPAEDDVDGWLAFERALAVDFAECGDASGYREAADAAWAQAQLRYYLDIEDETYAWQEEMKGYLEQAQEVIGE